MDVTRFEGEELGIGRCGDDAAEAEVEVDRVLGRGSRDIEAPDSLRTRLLPGQLEEPATEAPVTVVAADVKRLELKQVLARTDPLALQDDRGRKPIAIEESIEPAAAVEAVQQERGVEVRFAGRPALHVVMFRFEHEGAVLIIIDAVDNLATVDVPKARDFVAGELTAGEVAAQSP